MLDRPPRPVLRQDRLSCVLCPSAGGALGRFRLDTEDGPVDLVRPVCDEALSGGSSLDLASFPLVPFSNRIADGRFCFAGREVALDPRPCFGPHALHGDGWMAAWELVGADDTEAELLFERPAGDWPWSYEARQRFRLTADGLEMTLSLTNTSDGSMPAGIGLHPHFPAPAGTILEAGVSGMWTNGSDCLPDRHVAPPKGWDFASGAPLDGLDVDNCFTGWDGIARVVWPRRKLALRIEADPVYGHAVIYVPKGRGFVCVEPVSHSTDAVNRADDPRCGLRVLAPGETLMGAVRLIVERL
jgi:aldose 1-epimerase